MINRGNWWPAYKKYTQALKKLDHIPPVVSRHLATTTRMFILFKEKGKEFRTIPHDKVQSWIKIAETFYQEIKQIGEKSKQQSSTTFYQAYAQAIITGLQELASSEFELTISPSKQRPANPREALVEERIPIANQQGDKLYQLKKSYLPIMQARHEQKKESNVKTAVADEADRLESFLDICQNWLEHLYALEYSKDILKHNLANQSVPVIKEPLPLQFRLERNKPNYTVRLIKASYQNPTSNDDTILDIINGCHRIPTFVRDGKTLVDDSDVIRFIRLHSVKDDLMNFRRDDLSKLAAEMYQILVTVISQIRQFSAEVIGLINQTPIQDIEYAFAGINPEECRSLLRQKFQSMLPGINEDHYRATQKKKVKERSPRTIETMEEYKRNYEKAKNETFNSLKPTLAVAYWLRKMLMSIIRNNQALKKKKEPVKSSKEKAHTQPADKNENRLMVGISLTIGEADIANFYIDPDDIIGTEMSIQRVDRTDKWIAVRKSEKMHRILKRDFFRIIQEFIDNDLNPALKSFGFRELDLTLQLLPEIQERLGDEDRIDILRSGILGTTMTNLEEYATAKAFHSTLHRYFAKSKYDNIHYPDNEKLRRLAVEIANANTSILQMKYRRVLKVIEELSEPSGQPSAEPAATESEAITDKGTLKDNINKVKEIMIFAKPTLKDVKLESSSDMVVIKSGPATSQ